MNPSEHEKALATKHFKLSLGGQGQQGARRGFHVELVGARWAC
jgi:hypothetical protein